MELNEQYQAFCNACDDLRASKIILADAKVSKILRSVVSCPSLVEIIGDALVGYNYANELGKCVTTDLEGNKHINLPPEPYRVIALVFSILTEFDTRRLDLQEFVEQYFHADGIQESFERFCEELIVPFCDFLCDWVGYKTGKKEEESMNSNEEVMDMREENTEETGDTAEALFADLKIILNQIKETVNLDTKIKPDRLDDLNITLDALLESLELRNFKILNALLISLNNMLTPIKSVRFYNMELQNRLAKFYDSYL